MNVIYDDWKLHKAAVWVTIVIVLAVVLICCICGGIAIGLVFYYRVKEGRALKKQLAAAGQSVED